MEIKIIITQNKSTTIIMCIIRRWEMLQDQRACIRKSVELNLILLLNQSL